MSVLQEILNRKRSEIEVAKKRVSLDVLRARVDALSDAPRGFRKALLDGAKPVVIAEIKRRSPSKGEIRPNFDPVTCAQSYATAGAAALSVLTDEYYFGGKLEYLALVRNSVLLPILRKDFVLDAYQLYEARAAGADAVLLIVAALTREELTSLAHEARTIGLDVLVEVHDEAELEIAQSIRADLIGINNRDLRTFVTDLVVSERLLPKFDSGVVAVSESGISTYKDIERLTRAGAQAFLVGEACMREPDPGQALRKLRGE